MNHVYLPTAGAGGPTVQLGHAAATLSVPGSSRPYLHKCHKWVIVGWIEAVAVSSPLRLIVPVNSTPESHNGKICTLPAIFLRSHYIGRGANTAVSSWQLSLSLQIGNRNQTDRSFVGNDGV